MSTSSLRGALTAIAVGSILTLGAGGAQAATIIIWNFDTPTGTLASSQTYTAGLPPITIAALGLSGFTGTTVSPNGINLFGKMDGGVDPASVENGVGLTSDPSGENEISAQLPGDVVEVNFSNAKTAGVTNVMFTMGSTTSGESWQVFGSNSQFSGFTPLLSGMDQHQHPLALENFYIFQATNGNVLLSTISATTSSVPEPSTWAMMLLGFAGLCFAFRQSRRKVPFA